MAITAEGKNPWFTPTPGDLQSAVNAAVAASLPQKRLSTDARGHVQLEKVWKTPGDFQPSPAISMGISYDNGN